MYLRFKRNTVHNGEQYGPTCEETVCDVKGKWAAIYVAQSRAEPLTVEEIEEHMKGNRGGTRGLPGAQTREGAADPPAKCQGKTKSGAKCRKAAVSGNYCAQHAAADAEG